MAIKLTVFKDPTGGSDLDAAYLRIVSITDNIEKGRCEIRGIIHRDEAARRGGLAPVGSMGFNAVDKPATVLDGEEVEAADNVYLDNFADAAVIGSGKSLVRAAYEQIKAIPEYAGVDV